MSIHPHLFQPYTVSRTDVQVGPTHKVTRTTVSKEEVEFGRWDEEEATWWAAVLNEAATHIASEAAIRMAGSDASVGSIHARAWAVAFEFVEGRPV